MLSRKPATFRKSDELVLVPEFKRVFGRRVYDEADG